MKNSFHTPKIMVIIPARAGSKGLKNKNILKLLGKPLISYTVEAALEVFKKSQIIISTNSLKVKNIVSNHGINISRLRPENLSTDLTPMSDVICDVIENEFNSLPDYIVILQPTSPLRNSTHIKEALKLLYENKKTEMIVSVCNSKSNPYWNLLEEDKNGKLVKSKPGLFGSRQVLPPVYRINGAIYIIKTKAFLEKKSFEFNDIKKYLMSNDSSIDIDDFRDFKLAEIVIKNKLI